MPTGTLLNRLFRRRPLPVPALFLILYVLKNKISSNNEKQHFLIFFHYLKNEMKLILNSHPKL
jgi:hypothetical protein